jgi:nucleoside-diphosphate-sugar epimerase
MSAKILVTGASGFIGSHLTRGLDENGLELRAGVRRLEYADPDVSSRVHYVPFELSNPETMKHAVEGIDTIFHTAAIFNFYTPEKALFSTNVEGTESLLKVAREAGVKRFINWSSGAIYGTAYGNQSVREDFTPMPNDKYTRSKWAQEQAAYAANSRDMQVLNLRPGAVYGPGSKYGDASALYLLKRGILCVIPGFTDYFSSHLHVEDMINAAIHLSQLSDTFNPEADKISDLAYNVADDTPMASKDLLKIASSLIPKKGLLGFIPVRVPVFGVRIVAFLSETWARLVKTNPLVEIDSIDYIAAGHVLSNEKIKTTGFNLKYSSIVQGIKQTIDWYEKTGWSVFREN